MSDPFAHEYPSPLKGWENLPPLSDERNEDGKSFVNPPSEKLSQAYSEFPDPITKGIRGGFDIHIYYMQEDAWQAKFANELWERIRREFPELRIYKVWDKPLGPHPTAMFEVNVFNPAQFGAFIGWLVINRGPLSALVHPNTGNDYRDHIERAFWLGPAWPINTRLFLEMNKKREQQEAKKV